MTPGDLLSLVVDNYRQAHQRTTERQYARVEGYDRDIQLRQDILVRLHKIPNNLVINPEHAQRVRLTLRDRQLEVTKQRQQVAALEQDVEQLNAELRALVRQREQRLWQLWQEHARQMELHQPMPQRDELNKSLEQLREALPRLADECNRKMPDYERNTFYVYLRGRRYGTDDYGRSGLFRTLDDWLANKINYRENRRNELILRSMPDRVADLLGEHTEALRAMNRKDAANWATISGQLRTDPGALRRTLLAKQILAAEQRAFEAYKVFEVIALREDDWTQHIWEDLDEQLSDSQLSVEDCLEILMTEQPQHRAALEQMWQALDDQQKRLNDQLEAVEQALAEHSRALELFWAVTALRRGEPPSSEQRQCYCREGNQYRGLCPCTHEDERSYTYPASLDIPGLIAGYMKRNLDLQDVMDLLSSQRVPFDERAPDPTATTTATSV